MFRYAQVSPRAVSTAGTANTIPIWPGSETGAGTAAEENGWRPEVRVQGRWKTYEHDNIVMNIASTYNVDYKCTYDYLKNNNNASLPVQYNLLQ